VITWAIIVGREAFGLINFARPSDWKKTRIKQLTGSGDATSLCLRPGNKGPRRGMLPKEIYQELGGPIGIARM